MSKNPTPGGAQSATPHEHGTTAVAARNAQLGHVYYWDGDAVQVTHKNEDGSVRVQLVTGWSEDGKPSSLGPRVIRLLGDRKLMMRTTAPPAPEDGAPRAAPAAPVAVELPSGLTGTPKANPGGHLDRARIEAALPTMSDAELKDLLQTDKRAFVAPLVNNEQVRRELCGEATSPAAPPFKTLIRAQGAPPSLFQGPPPIYGSSPPQPKTPRSAPKAAPTPPAAPTTAPSLNDDKAARARAALAVLTHHAAALVECAAAYKELEALGLTAPRFM